MTRIFVGLASKPEKCVAITSGKLREFLTADEARHLGSELLAAAQSINPPKGPMTLGELFASFATQAPLPPSMQSESPKQPAHEPKAAATTSPIETVFKCCHGNIRLTIDPNEPFAHFEAGPGGLGMTAAGVRDLIGELFQVADALDKRELAEKTGRHCRKSLDRLNDEVAEAIAMGGHGSAAVVVVCSTNDF